MSSEKQINIEINKALDELADSGQPWRARWIAHGIIEKHKHGLMSGEHSEFWLHCGYSKTREMVTRRINKRAGTGEIKENRQHLLPGYEHVQSHYVVNRGGEEIGLPVHQLTDVEINNKIQTLRKISNACTRHAKELTRYLSRRKVTDDRALTKSHGETT